MLSFYVVFLYKMIIFSFQVKMLLEGWGPFGPPALFSKTIIDALALYFLIIIASIMHIYCMYAKAKFTRLMPKCVWGEFIREKCSGSTAAIMYCY